tara:strand:- start:857 stop:1693 length:837 start_codon:yes stop_codon:yes gene_type:complete
LSELGSARAISITEIILYPIKSCSGISVESADLEPQGLFEDRRFMLVDTQGRFLTQREHISMSRFTFNSSSQGWSVQMRGMPNLNLPSILPKKQERLVKIWKDEVSVVVACSGYNEWFSDAIGLRCELVQMQDKNLRLIHNGKGKPGDIVSLADGSPVLLTSEASLNDLNQRLSKPISMARFRPNLVISGDIAFMEDYWRYIKVGEVEFEVAWPCTRCVVTTIDPDISEKDPNGEPIKTLKRFRSSPDGVMFGQNLIPRRLGKVKVGDQVEVLEEKNL